ncbi:MAG: deoxyribonuclease IV [Olsenella sp.]|nr:deoxyribonuclease IV [Olsenella sp.]
MGLHLGCHLSASGGLLAMGHDAVAIGATTFAFFTRNPRGGNARDYDPTDAAALVELMEGRGFGPLVAHAPYTMNLCSAKEDVREFGVRAMREDLAKLELLGGTYYNFHPGSHVGQGSERGIELIVEGLDQVLDPSLSSTVLLETMAGKGTEIGRGFEELAAIIAGVRHPECLGVCLDTCHVHDAGYDIVDDLEGVLDEFDAVIGLSRLRALHLNDSKNPLGSHKDRHERIGEGELGVNTFANIVRNERLRGLPMVLETPNELEGYAREIALLRDLAEGTDS